MVFTVLRGRVLRQQRGAVAVEFAIVASLCFLLLFAILEFSLMFWANLTMQHAVREGARYAVTGSTSLDPDDGIRETAVVNKIKDSSMGLYDRVVVSTEITDEKGIPIVGFGSSQEIVVIKLNCAWPIVTPLVHPFFTKGKYAFAVSAAMRNEAF